MAASTCVVLSIACLTRQSFDEVAGSEENRNRRPDRSLCTWNLSYVQPRISFQLTITRVKKYFLLKWNLSYIQPRISFQLSITRVTKKYTCLKWIWIKVCSQKLPFLFKWIWISICSFIVALHFLKWIWLSVCSFNVAFNLISSGYFQWISLFICFKI